MTQLLNALPGALAQGLIWGVMAIGVYITYKVLDIADLTVDGSICTGAAVCTMLLLGEREDYRRRLRELGLGLEDRLTTKAGTLSGGQRQALTLLMATLQKPKLLLDEHTAALDPQTAQRVMDITDRLVRENHLTTLMITHNMRDAIHYGNRLLMLHNGRIVLDTSGEEKARLTVPDLLALFSKVSGQEYDNDRALLA